MSDKTKVTEKLDELTVSAFCENTAMMLEAGISPDEAIMLLCDDHKNEESLFSSVLKDMGKSIIINGSLSVAVKEVGVFPEYAVNMVEAGEAAGKLEHVLKSLSAFYRRRNALKERLKSALIYPLILLGVLTLVLFVLSEFVLPVFTGVYENMSGALSTSSLFFITLARVVSKASFGLVVLAFALVIVVVCEWKLEKGRLKLSDRIEKLPVVGKISFSLAAARFTDVIATFISSGMNVDMALDEAVKLTENKVLLVKLKNVQKKMLEGEGLAKALSEEKIYSPLYTRMLISAERSGKLEETLFMLAERTEAEAEEQIERVIEALEPSFTAVLTIVVGVSLLSVMLPLIGMLNSVR